jgi:aromatic ring-opening dioxygenase catalytic subunit (LigB family)
MTRLIARRVPFSEGRDAPKAIMIISAHHLSRATGAAEITASPHPQAIHDFGGFPDFLYQQRCPARGPDHNVCR